MKIVSCLLLVYTFFGTLRAQDLNWCGFHASPENVAERLTLQKGHSDKSFGTNSTRRYPGDGFIHFRKHSCRSIFLRVLTESGWCVQKLVSF